MRFIILLFIFVSAPVFAWKTYVSKTPSKNGANAQMIIPVSTTRIIQLTCGKSRLDLAYLMMDGISIVKSGYVGDLKFIVDGEEFNMVGDFYRHDPNFVGLKVIQRTDLINLMSALSKSKKDFYVYESRGGTYIPHKIHLSEQKKSIEKFTLACGI